MTSVLVGSGAWFGSVGMGAANLAMNFCFGDKITISSWRGTSLSVVLTLTLAGSASGDPLRVEMAFDLQRMINGPWAVPFLADAFEWKSPSESKQDQWALGLPFAFPLTLLSYARSTSHPRSFAERQR